MIIITTFVITIIIIVITIIIMMIITTTIVITITIIIMMIITDIWALAYRVQQRRRDLLTVTSQASCGDFCGPFMEKIPQFDMFRLTSYFMHCSLA